MDAALQHLIDQIKNAAAQNTAMRIAGSDSKRFYGEPCTGELLDLSRFSGITAYEPTELVVTARAGTRLTELEATLAGQGQCLAFEPPRFGDGGTVGGMVAAGLSGPARANVGGVRDYVLGVQLINGRGEHLTFGGQVMKNVAGYDVTRLMVGSLGCLGALTEVSIKVLPVAPAQATLVFEVDQARALTQLHRWGGQPLPLSASCWVRDDTAAGTPELLFVRLRGAAAAVAAAVPRMLQDLPGKPVDMTQASADWDACRDLRLPFFTVPPSVDHVLWRLSVPQTTPVLDLPWPQLIEWHGGQRWLWAPPDALTRLRAAAAEVGGYATLFKAEIPVNISAGGRFHPPTAASLAIHRRLKAEFDPVGIFNPGHLYPGL
jgi:glycolate oxidase FAD binding subunit